MNNEPEPLFPANLPTRIAEKLSRFSPEVSLQEKGKTLKLLILAYGPCHFQVNTAIDDAIGEICFQEDRQVKFGLTIIQDVCCRCHVHKGAPIGTLVETELEVVK